MKKDNIIIGLLLILCASVILNFFTKKNEKEIKSEATEIDRLTEVINAIDSIISLKIDSVKTIEIKKTFYKNYYYEISKQTDTISNNYDMLSRIRGQLFKLGPARFE